MPDSQARRPASYTPPEIVVILGTLGALLDVQDDPDLDHAHLEDVIDWACARINERTGISKYDLRMAILILARGRGLEGPTPGSDGYFDEAGNLNYLDLNHLAMPLRELDRDGTTARLCRKLCQKLPVLRGAWAEANSAGKPQQAQPTAAGAGVSAGPGSPVTKDAPGRPPNADNAAVDSLDQYVTLDQAAALVNRSKKTLERYLRNPKSEAVRMPDPDVEGTGGKAHEWRWTRLRPWLEATFEKRLPDQLPSRGSRPPG